MGSIYRQQHPHYGQGYVNIHATESFLTNNDICVFAPAEELMALSPKPAIAGMV